MCSWRSCNRKNKNDKNLKIKHLFEQIANRILLRARQEDQHQQIVDEVEEGQHGDQQKAPPGKYKNDFNKLQ